MTLQEYLHQDPGKHRNAGEVILVREEVKFGHCIRIHSELYYVQIKMHWWPRTYFLKSNDDILWTTDENGNPKSRSVFAYNATSKEWEKFKQNGK